MEYDDSADAQRNNGSGFRAVSSRRWVPSVGFQVRILQRVHVSATSAFKVSCDLTQGVHVAPTLPFS